MSHFRSLYYTLHVNREQREMERCKCWRIYAYTPGELNKCDIMPSPPELPCLYTSNCLSHGIKASCEEQIIFKLQNKMKKKYLQASRCSTSSCWMNEWANGHLLWMALSFSLRRQSELASGIVQFMLYGFMSKVFTSVESKWRVSF